jgi:putative endonuclease
MPFFAYIVRCADHSYYTGSTDLLETRIAQHNAGVGAAHTKHRRPVVMVWCQEFPTRLEALEAERRIKGWSRAKKEALIAGEWGLLQQLSRSYSEVGRPSTSSGRTEARASGRTIEGKRP